MDSQLIIIGIVVVVILIIMIAMYNSFVTKKNNTNNAFSAVDALLKLRFDLIPNLVATVRAYAKHEADTLSRVTAYRSCIFPPGSNMNELIESDATVSNVIRTVMIQLERYPVLQANSNFMHLQRSLNEIEAQLSAARRTYNAVATEYNTSIQIFPNCIFATLFRFKAKPLFEADLQERNSPDVRNLFS